MCRDNKLVWSILKGLGIIIFLAFFFVMLVLSFSILVEYFVLNNRFFWWRDSLLLYTHLPILIFICLLLSSRCVEAVVHYWLSDHVMRSEILFNVRKSRVSLQVLCRLVWCIANFYRLHYLLVLLRLVGLFFV